MFIRSPKSIIAQKRRVGIIYIAINERFFLYQKLMVYYSVNSNYSNCLLYIASTSWQQLEGCGVVELKISMENNLKLMGGI